jgi:hypothetical protein
MKSFLQYVNHLNVATIKSFTPTKDKDHKVKKFPEVGFSFSMVNTRYKKNRGSDGLARMVVGFTTVPITKY